MTKKKRRKPGSQDDLPWYKSAIIYQLHVKAFCDSNGDGIGDFRGLAGKLDYLHDLGVTAIWLLPFYPSPLKDDGYDISDYRGSHPAYGSMADFRAFLRAAHGRGLRVITELVINHTSDRHPWFQRARRAKPGSKWRDFYVWSDSPDRYKDARIIFQDFETSNWSWDPVANAYYWHRFFSHQPDLNFDNPQVQKEIFKVLDYWFGTGVDGLRLDAIPYLFEREGTNCENLPETHEFLKRLRTQVDAEYPGRMLLAEANQWPEDAVAYFGRGDECHMGFQFPLMPRLFMALRMEDRYPIFDILDQTPNIPESCQWAVFLRNHDELTLEMVTDEERDYMYRVYAQDPQMRINLGIRRRLAPLMGNHRRRIELMNSLLFSMPGTPIIYYGDELGMGDNIYLGDRNSVRTPMQWSADKNAGFSHANPQNLYLPLINDPEYHYETYNIEVQQSNAHSLLWWMKRLIAVRKRFKAFGSGSLTFLSPDNNKVLAFIRRHEEERILVVANLSRFIQYANLDLSLCRGMIPVEVFGGTQFPAIGEDPYFMTLAPHSFYWFSIETAKPDTAPIETAGPAARLPRIRVADKWESVFVGKARNELERILPQYLKTRRWFRGKARLIKSLSITDTIMIAYDSKRAAAALMQVQYMDGNDETYFLPLVYAPLEDDEGISKKLQRAAVVRLEMNNSKGHGVLCDAIADKNFSREVLNIMFRGRRLRGEAGQLLASATRSARLLAAQQDASLEHRILNVEQSNSSMAFGETFILKVFRQPDFGPNPDLEIGTFLTERGFEHSPKVHGWIHYQKGRSDPAVVAILQGYVPNQGDAWRYTLDSLRGYIESALTLGPETRKDAPSAIDFMGLVDDDIPAVVSEMIGHYWESVRVLGQRTAQLHLALASDPGHPDFALEPLSALSQRAAYQSMRSLQASVFQALRNRINGLPEETRVEAREIMDRQSEVMECFNEFKQRRISAGIIRCHGDYHLGQVLYTGKDFSIIDFEGEPARPLNQRRRKRSPLTDVAGMVRSFSYAAHSALLEYGTANAEEAGILKPWLEVWRGYVSAAFVKSYLETAGEADFIPGDREDLILLLNAFLMEKAIYELGYELNNRPEWVGIPLGGIKDILDKR
jgi:maltose alpha-D-glucosyltransferase/alpha-amylase